MHIYKPAITAAIIIYLSACSYYFPPSHEERVERFKKTCESLGLKLQTSEYANCVLDLEKSYLSGRSSNSGGSNTTNNDARTQQMIDQDRTQKQILNHGAGGCTPNFSTGGCL